MAILPPVIPDDDHTPTQRAAGSGYRGLFVRWIGGAARPITHIIKSHSTNTQIPFQRIRTHKTNSLVSRSVIKSHKTDVGLPSAISYIRSHTTSTALRSAATVQTRQHKTDADLYSISITRKHTTSASIVPEHTWTHSTDALLRGTRFIAGYTNALCAGTVSRNHKTDARPANVYRIFHGTNALLRRSQIRTHTTSVLKVTSHTLTVTTDALVLRIPLVWHQTDAASAGVRLCTHKTSTEATHVPINGRWEGPRVGTRIPVEIISKNRKQGSALYPVGFLLVSHDRITPLLGATPTVKLLKPGGNWATAVGAVREVTDGSGTSNGWYELLGDPADRNITGEFILMATAPGADTVWVKFDVVVPDPYAVITLPPIERNAIADATLLRAFASAASPAVRCVLRAAQSLFYWQALPAAPLVIKADDGTVVWQAPVTTVPAAKPIRGMDPIKP